MSKKILISRLRQRYLLHKDLVAGFRVFNTRSMILFYLIGLKFAGKFYFGLEMLLVVSIFILSYGYISLLNFIEDAQLDEKNHTYNPLLLSHRTTNHISILLMCAVLSILFATLSAHPTINVTGAAILMLLGYLYSRPPLRLSYHPLGKVMSMGLIYAYIPTAMGVLTTPVTNETYLFLFLLATLYTSWLPYSDVKDIAGDRKFGKNTLAVVLGIKQLSRVCFFVSSVCFLLLTPFLLSHAQRLLFPGSFYLTLLFIQCYFVIEPTALFRKKLQILGGYVLLLSLFSLVL